MKLQLKDPFAVESIRTDDLDAVRRLAWKTKSTLYPAVFFERMMATQRAYFRVVREAATDRVVGFVIAAKMPGADRNLLLLAIDPDHRGQGLRHRLLEQVQKILIAEGRREFSVEVRMDDRDHLDFYRREGFEVVGVEAATGPEPQDKLVMRKTLV